jgi:hypothetical protein
MAKSVMTISQASASGTDQRIAILDLQVDADFRQARQLTPKRSQHDGVIIGYGNVQDFLQIHATPKWFN